MKSTALSFATLLPLALAPAPAGETGKEVAGFFFPRAEFRLEAPKNWFPVDQTQRFRGQVFLSREAYDPLKGGLFQTGISVYTHFDTLLSEKGVQPFLDNRDAEARYFPALLQQPGVKEVSRFDLKTGMGTARVLEIATPGKRIWQIILCGNRGCSQLVVEAPEKNWAEAKPIFERMLASLCWAAVPKRGDRTVQRIGKEDLLDRLHRALGADAWPEVEKRLKALKPGLALEAYREALGWKTEQDDGENIVLTPGYLRRLPDTAPGDDFCETFGFREGRLVVERAWVRFEDGKLAGVTFGEKRPPADFPSDEWQGIGAGCLREADHPNPSWVRWLHRWACAAGRSDRAWARASGTQPGAPEWKFLEDVGLFSVWTGTSTLELIPGLVRCERPKREDGVREIVYTFGCYAEPKDAEPKILGQVAVVNGKVASVVSALR